MTGAFGSFDEQEAVARSSRFGLDLLDIATLGFNGFNLARALRTELALGTNRIRSPALTETIVHS